MTHERDANNFLFFRYLFALLVILSHSFELVNGGRATEPLSRLFGTLSFGELAVDGFFLLSGYLIFKSWDSDPRALVFMRKRILRIYPAFVVAAMVCVFLIAPLGAVATEPDRSFSLGKFLGELLRLKEPSTPAWALSRPPQTINGSMWSISYEFNCYLLVLALGIVGVIKKGRAFLACGLVTLLVLYVLMTHGLKTGVGPEVFGKRPLNNAGNLLMVRMLCMFVAGGMFYMYRAVLIYSPARLALSALALFLCLSQAYLAEVGVALFGGYLLFGFAFRDIKGLRRLRRWPDASYGLYLYAWPLQLLVMWQLPTLSPMPVFVLTACLALLAGLLSWYLIEKPCLRLNPSH